MKLFDRIAFDELVEVQTHPGVITTSWVQKHDCRVDFIYQRGGEVVEAARLEGRAIYKIRVRQCQAVRAVTTSWRARDVRRGTVYDIKEADAVSSRFYAFFTVEGAA